MSRSRNRRVLAAAALAVLALPPRPASAADPRRVAVSFSRVNSGLGFLTALAAPNDGTGRFMITERAGRIRVRLGNGVVLHQPYIDITGRVNDGGGEQGLLGMAFHPGFRTNGVFFVTYTDAEGDLRVSRFASTPRYNEVRPNTEVVFLEVPHRSYQNHNGGSIAFGRDGFLYIGTGDGGGGGDPGGNAQNVNSLLGKILRIDVNHACSPRRYCIPSSNPYAGYSNRRKEIWHFGLRNPWRFTFDRSNGDMYIADVGQGAREEVDLATNGTKAINWGWDCREGSLNPGYGSPACSGRAFRAPIREYDHASGRCSITGGYIYRGQTYASLLGGVYLHADYCNGQVFGLARVSGGWVVSGVYQHAGNITSFGEATNGELYAVDSGGSLYRITASSR